MEPTPAGATRVLVVDDETSITDLVAMALRYEQFAVAVAGGGREALDQVESFAPDLVVLDIMMDYDTDGFNVAFKLKNDPETARIPVVIVSGFTKELETKTHIFEPMMYREWPAAKFFEKPVKLADLADAIAGLLAGDAAPVVAKEA